MYQQHFLKLEKQKKLSMPFAIIASYTSCVFPFSFFLPFLLLNKKKYIIYVYHLWVKLIEKTPIT